MEASEKHSDWAFSGEIEAHQQRHRIETLTIVYFAYQALILCSLTGALPVSVGADHWWVPAWLSGSLSVLHFSYLVGAFHALHRAQRDADLARMELGRAHTGLEAGLMVRARFSLDGPTIRYRMMKRRVVSGVVGVLLVAFAAVMVVACLVVSPETAVDGGSEYY